MSVIFRDYDDHYVFGVEDQRNKLDHLPAGIFRLKMVRTENGVIIKLLKDVKQFTLPEKRFGRHEKIVRSVMEDYDQVNPPLGLMTIGVKGSGKSMLCEDICNRLSAKGLPILIVDDPIPHDILLMMAQAVGPSVFYFDEIGKTYPRLEKDDDSNASLNQLLPLFSNQSLIGRVFLITANKESELNEFFIDRPGRFKYRIRTFQMERVAYLDYMRNFNVPPQKMSWLETTWSDYTFDQLRMLVPLMHKSSNLREFLSALEILNVRTPSVCRIQIESILHHGISVELRSSKELKLSLNEDHLIVQLRDDVASIPWRNSDGTFKYFDNTDTSKLWVEDGDYSFGLSIARVSEWDSMLNQDDFIENTLVINRPRAFVDIVKEPNPCQEENNRSPSSTLDNLSKHLLTFPRSAGRRQMVE